MGNIVTLNLNQPETYSEFIAYASFESEPTEKNRSIAINLEVTHQELDSLFSTHKYERPYLPSYYNPLEDIIGELWTTESEAFALQAVIEKVGEFIPHITVSTNTQFEFENYKLFMELIFYFKNDFSKTMYNYSRQFDILT